MELKLIKPSFRFHPFWISGFSFSHYLGIQELRHPERPETHETGYRISWSLCALRFQPYTAPCSLPFTLPAPYALSKIPRPFAGRLTPYTSKGYRKYP
jgi:hypothetical protein